MFFNILAFLQDPEFSEQRREQRISCVSLTLHHISALSCYITSQSDSPCTRRPLPLAVSSVIRATRTPDIMTHNIRKRESLTVCFQNSVCLYVLVCMNRWVCVRAGLLRQNCSVMLCCTEVTGSTQKCWHHTSFIFLTLFWNYWLSCVCVCVLCSSRCVTYCVWWVLHCGLY